MAGLVKESAKPGVDADGWGCRRMTLRLPVRE
jgi:hypothetical protein